MSEILNANFILNLLMATIRIATPLLLVAIGELYSERAGMCNIGLDGLMSIGALFGFVVGYYTQNPWLAILAAGAVGVCINLIYAYATINLGADQIVYGMAINILCPALAGFLYKILFSNTSSLLQGVTMKTLPIPLLSKIPVIGQIFFQNSPLVYLAYLLVPLSYVFFYKTKAGLSYRAVGEYPRAAETLGINVILKKYLSCIICGAMAAIGGAFLTVCYTNTYSEGIVAGRGFIALSAVIFGKWTPFGILMACLVFGFCDALQIRLQLVSSVVPYQIFQMIPYLFTFIILIAFGMKKLGPKANGMAYFREER